jgi:putative peptide zinc metalloprotease protein
MAAGEMLTLLDDPELDARHAEAQNRVLAARVRYFNLLHSDRAQAQGAARALQQAEEELAHHGARAAEREVRAASSGRLALAREADLPGMFFRKGQDIGHVFAPGTMIVRAAVPDELGALLRQRTRGASVWLASEPGRAAAGSVRQDVPAASYQLPHAALSERNGGMFPTDPADTQQLRTVQPVFTVDIALTGGAQWMPERIGARAWVRLDFGWAPLAVQWAQATARVLLKHVEKVT